jgi:hypothetical protein
MTSSDQQLTTFTKKPADDQHFRLAIVSPKNHKQSHHYFNTMMIQ